MIAEKLNCIFKEESTMLDLKKIQEKDNLVMSVIDNLITPKHIKHVRICKVDNDYILNGNDCAVMLGYKNPRNSVGNKISSEYKVSLKPKNFIVAKTATMNYKNNSIVSKTDTISHESNFVVPKIGTTKSKNNLVVPKSGTTKINNTGEVFITREGFLELCFGSKLKEAEAVRKWVSSVIVQLIDTGKYELTKKDKLHNAYKLFGKNPDIAFKNATSNMVDEIAINKKLLKGKVWKMFVVRFNNMFNVDLETNRKKFMKKYKINRLTVREFMDVTDTKDEAILCMRSLVMVPTANPTHSELEALREVSEALIQSYSFEDIRVLDKRVKNKISKMVTGKKGLNLDVSDTDLLRVANGYNEWLAKGKANLKE